MVQEKKVKSVHNISPWWGLFGILFILFFWRIGHNMVTNLPDPLKNAHETNFPERFIAERAWKDLKAISGFGPKPVGSFANEVLAVNFLTQQILYINETKSEHQTILLEKQVSSGVFSGVWGKHSATSAYLKVQNVVVKLVGTSEHALLINCHFDSVAGSPGASDDASSCVVMLEILRVLSRQSTVNKHSVVFLFNGAEETQLQGAHAFITKHIWSKEVKAFLNLESAGSGGKEILFQSGPKHPWLIKIYSKAIMHPFAHAAAEELFQSRVIPSDTDFRIFRDFGGIPGMDFAYMTNGYRYHTKYDAIDYVPMNVLQRTGDNILELTKAIANSAELEDTKSFSQGFTVYFDFLGLFFVSYSAAFGINLNIIIVILSVIIPYASLKRATRGVHGNAICWETFIGLTATLLSAIVSGLVCFLIAHQLDAFGRSMSWYSSTNLLLGIYCCPAVLTHCLVHILCDKTMGSVTSPLSLGMKVQARLNGTSLFWGLVTLAVTFAGFRVGYTTMILVFCFLSSSILILILNVQNSVHKWLYIHLFFQMFTILWASQFYHVLVKLIVPITGRSGAHRNPDNMMAGLCLFLTILTCSFMTPLIHLLRKTNKLLIGLGLATIASLFLATCTHVGFPYRDDSAMAPAVQRHYITHTTRILHDFNGKVRFSDSGYLFREMDRHSSKTIEEVAFPKSVSRQVESNLCGTEVFCALPLYSVFHQFSFGGYWLSGPKPVLKEVVTVKLNEKMVLDKNTVKMHFTLAGSVQTSIMIKPKEGVVMTHWNILNYIVNPVEYNKEKAHFILISHGLRADNTNFTLEFKHEISNPEDPLVDITIITTHWEYQNEHTEDFSKLLDRLPKWAHAVPSVAAVVSYIF